MKKIYLVYRTEHSSYSYNNTEDVLDCVSSNEEKATEYVELQNSHTKGAGYRYFIEDVELVDWGQNEY